MMKPRILVVANDASLRGAVARWLLAAGYAVELAESARRAREVVANADTALTILAPDGLGQAGIELAQELAGQVERLIVLVGQTDEAATFMPASAQPDGAASCPLNEQEVLGRVKAALDASRIGQRPVGPQVLQFEGYTLDAGGRICVDANGQNVTLTRAEFSLLLALARQPGRVLSRDELSHAAAGRSAESDDRSVDVLISRLRRKIEPDARSPRMIVTVPGEGYKLAAQVQAAVPPPLPDAPALAISPNPEPRPALVQAVKAQGVKAQASEADATQSREARVSAYPRRRIGPLGMAATAGAMFSIFAGLALVFRYPGLATRDATEITVPAQKFDAAVIPLVNDEARRVLASYAARPDVKALAISAASGNNGWGLAFGSPDAKTAKKDALERCRARSAERVCEIYAVGMDVVWSPPSLLLPMPADVHTELLDIPLVAAEIPTLDDAQREEVAKKYVALRSHKALALRPRNYYWNGADTREEAVRLAIERCSHLAQFSCLLLSVDGMLTIQIPRLHPVEDLFMLSTEPAMSEADRQRIAQIYAGRDWRALARGRSGHWYAVAGRESEAAAVDAALKTCRTAEPDCVLHAIGNWRVGEKPGSDR